MCVWLLRGQSVNEKKQADVSTSAATIAFANTLGAASNQLAAATIRADEGKAFVKAKKVCLGVGACFFQPCMV